MFNNEYLIAKDFSNIHVFYIQNQIFIKKVAYELIIKNSLLLTT